jgi:hypothetical protein
MKRPTREDLRDLAIEPDRPGPAPERPDALPRPPEPPHYKLASPESPPGVDDFSGEGAADFEAERAPQRPADEEEP